MDPAEKAKDLFLEGWSCAEAVLMAVLESFDMEAEWSPRIATGFAAGVGGTGMVCGAISRPLQCLVASCGITVIPFVAGDLQEVIQAWLDGRIEDELFAMPGCCGLSRRGGVMGLRTGHTQCCTEDTARRESGFICICPNCSYYEPHERGIPCSRKQCPVCGNALIRGQKPREIRIKEDQRP